ncbi:hypothetical protein ABM58_003150 [Salmonella enterica subsp. enterica]|nr:hypothetical protein [Salmonella enterica subsp. enterica serovar Manchester]
MHQKQSRNPCWSAARILSPRRAPPPCPSRIRVQQTCVSPVNKKGPSPARENNTPSKAPADAFCVVLFRFV